MSRGSKCRVRLGCVICVLARPRYGRRRGRPNTAGVVVRKRTVVHVLSGVVWRRTGVLVLSKVLEILPDR